MGIYLQGYKTKFEKLNYTDLAKVDLEFWSELMKYCDPFDVSVKSTSLVMKTAPIEYGTKFMMAEEKKFYNTFFYFTMWLSYDTEDENYINNTKYTLSPNCDDLGWLKLDKELYFRSFNKNTLESIVKDYEKIDFDFIFKKFNIARQKSQKEFATHKGFNLSNYQKETKETFRNFKDLTDQIINMYKNCVSEKKDIIISYD